MPDHLSVDERSVLMSKVRSADTRPELLVRRLIHGMGYRFRLHRRDLPGTPDVVLPKRKKAIFVHGCFWHQHGCKRSKRPGTRPEFWNRKLDANIERDKAAVEALRKLGWSLLVVWECETRDLVAVRGRIRDFLEGSSA